MQLIGRPGLPLPCRVSRFLAESAASGIDRLEPGDVSPRLKRFYVSDQLHNAGIGLVCASYTCGACQSLCRGIWIPSTGFPRELSPDLQRPNPVAVTLGVLLNQFSHFLRVMQVAISHFLKIYFRAQKRPHVKGSILPDSG